MHIPSLVKICWCLLIIIRKRKTDGWTDVRLTDGRTTDGRTDRHTDVQRETIISRHYRVAGYKTITLNNIPSTISRCVHSCVSDVESSIFEFGHIRCSKTIYQLNIENRMANSVDPEEMDHYKHSHQDLHCLQKYLFCSAGLKRLRGNMRI